MIRKRIEDRGGQGQCGIRNQDCRDVHKGNGNRFSISIPDEKTFVGEGNRDTFSGKLDDSKHGNGGKGLFSRPYRSERENEAQRGKPALLAEILPEDVQSRSDIKVEPVVVDLVPCLGKDAVFVSTETGEDAGILGNFHGMNLLLVQADIFGRWDRRGGIELLSKLDEVKAFLAVGSLDLAILLDHAVELEDIGIGIVHVFRDRGEVSGNLREDGAVDVIADELEFPFPEGNLHGNGEDLVNGEGPVGIVERAGELDGTLFLLVLFPVLERDSAE